MAPSSPVVQQNGAAKAKRPVPPGIQTNGPMPATSSPSPSISAKKPPPSARQTPTSAGDRTITASTVRPVNRARREASFQAQGRNSRNSAGIRAASFSADMAAQYSEPLPYGKVFSCLLAHFLSRPWTTSFANPKTNVRFSCPRRLYSEKVCRPAPLSGSPPAPDPFPIRWPRRHVSLQVPNARVS